MRRFNRKLKTVEELENDKTLLDMLKRHKDETIKMIAKLSKDGDSDTLRDVMDYSATVTHQYDICRDNFQRAIDMIEEENSKDENEEDIMGTNYVFAGDLKEQIKIAATILQYVGITLQQEQSEIISLSIDDCRVDEELVLKILQDCWIDIGNEEGGPQLQYFQTSTKFVEDLLDQADIEKRA